jgi:hypothetical protein
MKSLECLYDSRKLWREEHTGITTINHDACCCGLADLFCFNAAIRRGQHGRWLGKYDLIAIPPAAAPSST